MFEDDHASFPKKRVVKKVLESSSSTSSSTGSVLTRGDSETSTEGNAIAQSPLLLNCAREGSGVKEEMLETGSSEESTRLLSQALGFSSHNLPQFTSPLMPNALGAGLFPHWWMMPTLSGTAEADGGGD